MKKTLLVALGLGLVVSVNAQNNKNTNPKYNFKKQPWDVYLFEPSAPTTPSTQTPTVNQRSTPLVITNAVVCDSTLGDAGNAFGGFTRPGRQILSYYPSLNILTFIHRSLPPPDANTGYYRFDYSPNGGMSWMKNQGPIYTPPGPILARYPSATVFNPTGNTVADSAYISFFGPSCSNCAGSGDEWVHYVMGATQLGNVNQTNQMVQSFTPNVASHGLIPDAMWDANGTIWVSDMGYDGVDYTDSIMLSKGVWNPLTRMHDYTFQRFYAPVETDNTGAKAYVTSNIAFNSTGLTGYLSIIGNDDYATET